MVVIAFWKTLLFYTESAIDRNLLPWSRCEDLFCKMQTAVVLRNASTSVRSTPNDYLHKGNVDYPGVPFLCRQLHVPLCVHKRRPFDIVVLNRRRQQVW